jgi:hypothetical protein
MAVRLPQVALFGAITFAMPGIQTSFAHGLNVPGRRKGYCGSHNGGACPRGGGMAPTVIGYLASALGQSFVRPFVDGRACRSA